MDYKTVCPNGFCSGCMACVAICPQKAISVVDDLEAYNAKIDQSICINCSLCEKVCHNISTRKLLTPLQWKQGWAEEKVRKHSSSGGAASAIIKRFIEDGGYVASCLFNKGEFGFVITNNEERAWRFAGSKYVKSNPGNIYNDIKALLEAGEKVLFVGLPCQSAAVQNYCDINHLNNLYTIDLICHGTPSPKILKQFIKESGIDWFQIADIQFREKEIFGLSADGVKITPARVTDSYMRAFLEGVDYTENCYGCRYATVDRVSDITLGDAWGQMSEIDPKGVSLILCQTSKGIELVQSANLQLIDVDISKAIEANHQLRHPSRKQSGRKNFMKAIKSGRSVRCATFLALPKDSIKQSVKTGLIMMGIMKGARGVRNNDTV